MSRNFELLQKIEEQGELALDHTLPELRNGERLAERRPQPGLQHTLPGGRTPGDTELFKLVQRLFCAPAGPSGFHSSHHAPQAAVFSDVEFDDGAAVIAARAGEILASCSIGAVCLVDANLSAPYFHQHFGLENRRGLVAALCQPGPVDDFLQQIGNGNLWVMTCDSDQEKFVPPDPARLPIRIRELRQEFDFVLVHAPAANAHDLPLLLAQAADGLVLVVQAHSTRRATMRKVKQDLELANVCVLGAVLNNRTFPIPESLYSRL